MRVIRSFLILLVLFSLNASAQYFGRNKVQWEKFDFRVLKTQHFDIYYYPEAEPVVQDIGRMAERWYERLSRVFGHQFERKPIVLYANHPDFQQTTTTGGLIGEGTGGFTDSFLNRVVLPLTPVNADNDHVLGHELVHVFQFDISNRVSQTPGRRFNVQQLPLWIIEGLAEYFSQGREDPQTAMWLRDAAINNRMPDLKKITRDPRLSPYQFGQGFWAYVGGRWGDDNVTRLFLASGIVGVEEAFSRVLGATSKEVFEGWAASVRETYDPIVSTRWKPEQLGKALLNKENTGGDLNVSPAISPDGRRVAFLSTRDLFTIGLFLADAQTGKVLKRIVSSDSNPHFDALRFIDSSGSWSPDGEKLAFVVIERGDNRIAIVDVDSGRIEERIKVPGVNALSNPAWSPDGRQIAFSGQARGVSDLYIYDLQSNQVRQITNDPYSDLQPAWSPDGGTLAFVTDRGASTDLALLEFESLRLALVSAGGGAVQLLDLFPETRHINPQFSPDGENLYFIANPGGISDVFRYSVNGGALARVSNVATGVAGITDTSPAMSVAMRSGDVVFSLFEKGRYSIYRANSEAMRGQVVAREGGPGRAGILPPITEGRQETVVSYLDMPTAGLPPRNARFRTGPYDSSLKLTYLGPPTVGAGVSDYGVGLSGSINAYFSDILGTHEVGTALVTGGSSGQSFSSSIAGQVYYLNKEQRINYGAAVSHIPYVSAFTSGRTEVINVDGQPVLADIIQQQRQIQTVDELTLLSHYPLSRTRRMEANAGFSHYGFKLEVEEAIVVGNQIIDHDVRNLPAPDSINLYNAAFAFVGDSSFYGFVSPVKGTRYRFEVGTVHGDLAFQTALADYRRYFFARPVTFAIRGLHYGRYGDDSEDSRLSDLYIGRSTLVRGYDLNDISLSECVREPGSAACPVFDRLVGSKLGVVSAELRLPLVGTEDFGLIRGSFMPVELAAFVDGGVAWTEDEEPKLTFEEDSTERVPVFSAGITARILLGGYLPLQFYYAFPFQRPQQDAVFGFAIAPGW